MTGVTLHAPFAGWLGVLDEVPDPVFAERMMGDGAAIDPIEGVARAPADALVVALPDSGHAVTLRLDNGVELLLHIGLETVALAGRGFTPRVKAGDRVRSGDPLIAFDLDAVARAAKDMVTPLVAIGDGATVTIDRPGRLVAAGEAIGQVSGGSSQLAESAATGEQRRAIVVTAPHGIHARPAARIVATLRPFAAAVTLHLGDREASAASIVALLAMGAKAGDTIDATADGPDAAAALDALMALAAERFGDTGDAPAVRPPPRAGGVCASPGLAVGEVRQWRAGTLAVPEEGRGAAIERDALATALAAVAAAQIGHGPAAGIAEAHRALLADPVLRGDADAAIDAGKSAAFAWRATTAAAAAALRATGDALLIERVADLDDLERQVTAALLGVAPAPAPTLAKGTILIAEDLLPSQLLALDRDRLAGICTAAGGPTAHVAILAAAAGVPMIVAAGSPVLAIPDGRTVILDADAARLDADPDVEALAAAATQIADRRTARAATLAAAHAPCVTADGTRIEIFANLGSVDDAAAAVSAGAEGCGLLRTEFLFLDRDTAPGEEEQRALYARIATTLGDRPLIVRTLDIGGDKPVAYLPRAAEDNPALGLRGVRFGLARPDLLRIQLRAILRGVPGAQCRIMLPMIVDLAELRAVRALLDAAIRDTGRAEPVALGVMIETPAAALLADQLAREADFLSVGTNDLTQYALAADRGNAGVAPMVDALHPAVLRLIAAAADGARAHGRWLGVCGGLAADPAAAAILVGLGVTELSAVPAAIPGLKAAVRRLDLARCRALAVRACAAESAGAVRALLADAA